MLTLVFPFHITTWHLQVVRLGRYSPPEHQKERMYLSLDGSSVAYIEDLLWHCTGGGLP